MTDVTKEVSATSSYFSSSALHETSNNAFTADDGTATTQGVVIFPSRKETVNYAANQNRRVSSMPLDPMSALFFVPTQHIHQSFVRRETEERGRWFSLLRHRRKLFRFYDEHNETPLLLAQEVSTRPKSKHPVRDGERTSVLMQPEADGVSSLVLSLPHGMTPNGEGRPRPVARVCVRGGGREYVVLNEHPNGKLRELAAIYFDDSVDGQRRIKVILPSDLEAVTQVHSMRVKGEPNVNKSTHQKDETALKIPGDSGLGSEELPPLSFSTNSSLGECDKGSLVNSVVSSMPSECVSNGASMRAFVFTISPTLASWRQHSELVRMYRRNRTSRHIIVLQSKNAVWNDALRGYQMDFRGRANVASEKNFQLYRVGDPTEQVVMLFGKQDNDRFAVDFRYPMCFIQAAAAAVAAMTMRIITF